MLGAAPLGCRRNDGRAELSAAIRSVYGSPDDARPIATAAGWKLERALDVLLRSETTAPLDGRLRDHMSGRIRLDFVEDRIQLVARRWLSETEIALAVVLAANTQ